MGTVWDYASWGTGSWSGAAWNENAGRWWDYNASEDATVLQPNEVLVDHQIYNLPEGYTDKTWAASEKSKPYVIMLLHHDYK
jgi:hypothetical protein